MSIYLIIALIVILVIVILAVPGFFMQKEKRYKKTGKYPKGHFMGLGIALGIPLGIPLGVAMGNIGVGLGIGAAIGVALGSALESRNKGKLRPLTKKEKKLRNILMFFLVIIAILGLIVFGRLVLGWG